MGQDRSVINPLLTEAALFGYDTFFDEAGYTGSPDQPLLPDGNALDRGWQPLDAVVPGGVQVVGLDDLAPGVPFSSAAHFYVGELEGRRTLAIAFRSTDEGPPEFAFQAATLGQNPDGTPIYGWDLYQAAHAEAVAAALAYAQDASHGIERILIAGHSLGGVIAELTTARVLGSPAFAGLADRAEIVTFGSPGSVASPEAGALFNLIHSDDLIPRLSDLSPLFVAAGIGREGTTLPMARPEGSLPDFRPEDLDTEAEVAAAIFDPANRVEHPILLYIDTARLLDEGQHVIPGVAQRLGEPDRWAGIAAERGVVGTGDVDSLPGGRGDEILFGRDGHDRLYGGRGDDGLSGGRGADRLSGGPGDDLLDGNRGHDLVLAGLGDDTIYTGIGLDRVDGGPGRDTVVIEARVGDLHIERSHDRLIVSGDGFEATLTRVERLALEDGVYRVGEGGLAVLPEDPAPWHATLDQLF